MGLKSPGRTGGSETGASGVRRRLRLAIWGGYPPHPIRQPGHYAASRHLTKAGFFTMSTSGSKRAIMAALLANLGISVAKFAGFLITRSSSLLAESVHSVADSTNQALLLFGARRAARPATKAHPFGYGRERYFWSFVVAVVLFTAGAAFAIYEGVAKLRNPHALENVQWAIGILLLGLLLESFSLRTAVREANHERGGQTWWRYVIQAKKPELPVVLLEDVGALLGLLIALSAVVLSEVTGQPRWDGVGTLVIGLLLFAIAAVLAREMQSLLIGEAVAESDQQAITKAITETTGVVQLVHLRTQHLGPDDILVGAKVTFATTLDGASIVETIDHIEQHIRLVVPSAHPIYIEPVS